MKGLLEQPLIHFSIYSKKIVLLSKKLPSDSYSSFNKHTFCHGIEYMLIDLSLLSYNHSGFSKLIHF